MEELFSRVANNPGYQVTVNLETQTVEDDQGLSYSFDVDSARRDRMLKGLDDIAVTLSHADKIAAYEAARGIAN